MHNQCFFGLFCFFLFFSFFFFFFLRMQALVTDQFDKFADIWGGPFLMSFFQQASMIFFFFWFQIKSFTSLFKNIKGLNMFSAPAIHLIWLHQSQTILQEFKYSNPVPDVQMPQDTVIGPHQISYKNGTAWKVSYRVYLKFYIYYTIQDRTTVLFYRYSIYPKYLDTLTTCHYQWTGSKFRTGRVLL